MTLHRELLTSFRRLISNIGLCCCSFIKERLSLKQTIKCAFNVCASSLGFCKNKTTYSNISFCSFFGTDTFTTSLGCLFPDMKDMNALVEAVTETQVYIITLSIVISFKPVSNIFNQGVKILQLSTRPTSLVRTVLRMSGILVA